MIRIVVAAGIALSVAACAAPAAPSTAPTTQPTHATTPPPATGARTSSPTATSVATSSPAAAAATLPPAGGRLFGGMYEIADPKLSNVQRLTFAVPDGGWQAADFVGKDVGTPAEVSFGTWVVSDIFTDACKWDEASIVNVGTTAEQLVTALAAQKSRTASAVTDTTVAGYPAKRIELTVAPTLDTSTCTNGNLRYWPDPGPDFSGGLCCNKTGNIDDVTAVDVNGKVMVIVARHWPGSSSQNLFELQSIVDSVQIQP